MNKFNFFFIIIFSIIFNNSFSDDSDYVFLKPRDLDEAQFFLRTVRSTILDARIRGYEYPSETAIFLREEEARYDNLVKRFFAMR